MGTRTLRWIHIITAEIPTTHAQWQQCCLGLGNSHYGEYVHTQLPQITKGFVCSLWLVRVLHGDPPRGFGTDTTGQICISEKSWRGYRGQDRSRQGGSRRAQHTAMSCVSEENQPNPPRQVEPCVQEDKKRTRLHGLGTGTRKMLPRKKQKKTKPCHFISQGLSVSTMVRTRMGKYPRESKWAQVQQRHLTVGHSYPHLPLLTPQHMSRAIT